MPNWVINAVHVDTDNFDSFIDKYSSIDDEGNKFFDFNKIVPMPEGLNIEKSSRTTDGLKLYLTSLIDNVNELGDENHKMTISNFAKMLGSIYKEECLNIGRFILKHSEIEAIKNKYSNGLNEVINLGRQAFINKIRYGYQDWYDWSLGNWGTKWNACNSYFDKNNKIIYFDTAWSPAVPIYKALTESNRDINFNFTFAEEQAGYLVGEIHTSNGEITHSCLPKPFSKEAYEKFFELWGGEEEYKFNKETGTYEYIESDYNEEEL